MGYVGNQTTNSYSSFDKQDLTGVTGSPAKRGFTLSHAVANAQEIEVFVNNVRQEPGEAYTVSGTGLTMTGDVETTDDFYVVFQGKALQTIVPPDASVTKAKMGTTELDLATIKDSTGTNTAMTIDSSGVISTPARPAFYAYGDDGWVGLAAINTYYIGGFDHTEFNIGSHYNTSTKLFTVPVSGVYLFRSQVYFNDTSNPQVQIAFRQTSGGSTTTIAFTSQQQAGDGTIGITRIYNAVAGQQIGAYVYKSVLVANTDYYLGINHSYFLAYFWDRSKQWHYH